MDATVQSGRGVWVGQVPTPAIKLHSRHILGMRVDCTRYDEAVALIGKLSREKRGASVCVATVHMVMEAVDDPDLRRAINAADLVTSDGMPLVWGQVLWQIPTPQHARS